MKHQTNSRSKLRNSILSIGVVLTTLSSPNVWAGLPWLSGPSSAEASQAVVFSGGNYPPNTVLTVKVSDSVGNEYASSVVSAADGSVKYEVVPNVEGFYNVKILDNQKNIISSAGFSCFKP